MARAGKLIHTFAIEEPLQLRDAETGQIKPTWRAVASCVFGERIAVGGGETIRGKQVEAITSHAVLTHWRPNILPTMRLRFADGEILHIVRADDPDGRRRDLLIQCRRNDNAKQ